MSAQQMTIAMVYAAGRDAGNRSMRKAGRSKWNSKDFDTAAAEFARLAPAAVDLSPATRAALALRLDRTTFLGGSDVAAIIGRSPWDTPLTVYLWKIGEPTEDMLAEQSRKAKLYRRGKREEPYIIDDLEEDYGVKVTKRSPPTSPNRYRDAEHDFLSAEVDFEWEVTQKVVEYVRASNPAIATILEPLIGTTQNGEAKSVHHFAAGQFGDADSEDVPVYYAAQAMHGLMVTGRQITLFGVRVGNGDVILYWLVRDEDTIKRLRPRLVKFWHEHVLARVAPEPMDVLDISKLFLRAPAPIVVDAEGIEVDAHEVFPDDTEASGKVPLALVHEEFEKAKSVEKAAADRIDDLKFILGKAMLGADAIARAQKPRGGLDAPRPTAAATPVKHMLKYNRAPLLTIALEQQTRIDSDAVRKNYPEVAAECSKVNKFFKFREPTKSEKLLAR